MKYFPKLQGERIYLSPMNIEDAEKYTCWLNDASVTDGMGLTRQICSLEREKETIKNLMKDGYNFAIILNENDQLIGNLGLADIHHTSRSATCGIFIGDALNRSKGYGAEALKLLLNYGFNTLNLNNIMLKVFSFNEQAIRCYKKVGFKVIGARRQSYFVNGKYHDDIFMDILADEFNSN